MAIAKLSIDLEARLAGLQEGLDKATFLAQKSAGQMEAAFGGLKTTIAGLGIAGIVAGELGKLKQAIDGLDALNDLRDATGSSIEKLSALEDVARRNGQTLDTVGTALTKLNGVLKGLEPNSAAAQILEKLGLDAAALKREDPAEALRQIAVAFTGYADDGSKARGMQELLGKSTREVAQFIHDLGEQTQLVGSQTKEATDRAEQFNKNLAELRTRSEDAARSIANVLIPAVNHVFADYKEGGIAKALGLDTATAKVSQLADTFEVVRLGILRLGPLAALKINPNNSAALASLDEIDKRARAATATFTATGAALSKVLNPAPINKPLPTLGDTKTNTPKSGTSAKADEAARYIESLRQQLQRVDELTVGEKLLEDVQAGRFKETKKGQFDTALGYAVQIDAQRAFDAALKDSSTASADWTKQQLHMSEQSARFRQSLEQETASLRDEIAIIQGGEPVRKALAQARADDAIAAKELEHSLVPLNQQTEVQLENMRQEIDLLRERAGLVKRRAVVQEEVDKDPVLGAQKALADYQTQLENSGIATREAVSRGMSTLEDDLTASLASGKFSVKSFVDYALQEVIRLQVVRPLIASLFSAGSGSSGGGFGGLIGAIIGFFGNSGGGGFDGSHAGGLNYVPFDGYKALLHRGERVKTAAQSRREDQGEAQPAPIVQYHVNVQGDASSNTIRLINGALAQFQARQARGARYG